MNTTRQGSFHNYTHSFSSVSNADVSAFSISLTNTGSSSNFYHCNGCNIQAEIGVPNGSKDSCTDTVADSTYSSWKYWNSFSCNTSGGNYANIESALANGSMKATIKSGSYYSDNSVTSVYGSWSWSVTYSVPAVPDPRDLRHLPVHQVAGRRPLGQPLRPLLALPRQRTRALGPQSWTY